MNSYKIANHEMYTIYENGEVYSGIHDIKLVQRTNPNGYQIVSLNSVQLAVHRLVARHFIPNPYEHPQINHKDGNKCNNHVSNLEWCSAAENSHHALATGLRKGYVHVDVKREMLERVLQGEIIADIAPEVGNHPNTLTRMLRVQAKKDGLEEQWADAMYIRRRDTALKNLEVINA